MQAMIPQQRHKQASMVAGITVASKTIRSVTGIRFKAGVCGVSVPGVTTNFRHGPSICG